MIWIYKCNSRNQPYQRAYGDWNDFFMDNRATRWGTTEWVPALSQAGRGDTILAYQTDRNELIGIARVVRLRPRGRHVDLILKPLRRIGVKVRPLKARDSKVSAIPALKPGPIRTLYPIARADAARLLRAAGIQIRLERMSAKMEGRRASVRGGGFGSSTENRVTERRAVARVTRHFRSLGWGVRDISKEKRGYDLLCTRKGARLHVEVKGVTGSKRQFIITVGERRLWQTDRSFVLALVTNARSTNSTLDFFPGPGSAQRFHFEPLAFMAST